MMTRLLGVLTVLVLAGCASAPGPGPGPGGEGADREMKQAREALARWDAAVAAAGGNSIPFAPTSELTGQIGNWEDGNNKQSLMAGKVMAGTGISETAPAPTEIRWADGKALKVPVISAAQGVREIVAGGLQDPCPDCKTLEMTTAKLTSGKIATSRGEATVPVWEYEVRDSKVKITRVAVDPAAGITVVPPPWDPYNGPAGMRIESAVVSKDRTKLTVTFTGTPGPKSQSCGADYTAKSVESANAVVVIVHADPHGTDETCTAIGAVRTAVVTLDKPLAERAVLEVTQGLPVPVTIASS